MIKTLTALNYSFPIADFQLTKHVEIQVSFFTIYQTHFFFPLYQQGSLQLKGDLTGPEWLSSQSQCQAMNELCCHNECTRDVTAWQYMDIASGTVSSLQPEGRSPIKINSLLAPLSQCIIEMVFFQGCTAGLMLIMF